MLILAVAVLVPRIGGGTPYTVLSGSMRPTYPEGTLVVVKPVPTDQIGIGDVITYQRESGRSTVVTHRVVAVGTRTDGELVFTTQGDANNTVDAEPVRPVQVRGRLWYSIPYLGHVNSALTGRQRQTAVIGVSTLLIGYAAFMFVGAVRDRRRPRAAADRAPVDQAEAVATDRVAAVEPGRHDRRRVRPELAAGAGAAVAVVLLVWAVRRHRRRQP